MTGRKIIYKKSKQKTFPANSLKNKITFLSIYGVMLEWLKRHAWKACIRQKRIGGSNPPPSAKYKV